MLWERGEGGTALEKKKNDNSSDLGKVCPPTMPRDPGCKGALSGVARHGDAPYAPGGVSLGTQRRLAIVRRVKSQVFKPLSPVPRKNASDRIHPHSSQQTETRQREGTSQQQQSTTTAGILVATTANATSFNHTTRCIHTLSPISSRHDLARHPLHAVQHPLFGPAQVESGRGHAREPAST